MNFSEKLSLLICDNASHCVSITDHIEPFVFTSYWHNCCSLLLLKLNSLYSHGDLSFWELITHSLHFLYCKVYCSTWAECWLLSGIECFASLHWNFQFSHFKKERQLNFKFLYQIVEKSHSKVTLWWNSHFETTSYKQKKIRKKCI